MAKPRVLLVEDTPSIIRLYRAYLKPLDAELIDAETGGRALEVLDEMIPEIVLLDLELPDMNGREILKAVRARGLPTIVIVITAHGSVATAVEAMREGAYDFIIKPFSPDRLIVTVRNALDRQRLAGLASHVEIAASGRFCGFIGASFAMRAVYDVIENTAKSRATIFITGESGTGKELCAAAIHAMSPRRNGPFVAINCGAIPKDLMESEIFGHVKGAFTGAVGTREGVVARARGGTLFLDEICEMDLGLQVKLLRVLQSEEFQKVGGTETEKADVRYVCATNRDPWAEVNAGRFREDLFYRLHVVPCPLPPLRDRDDDVMLLARHFLQAYAQEEGKHFTDFDASAEQALRAYSWPGNVRQLQNVMRNVVLMHEGEIVTASMLPLPAARGGPLGAPAGPGGVPPGTAAVKVIAAPAPVRPLWMVEKEAIEQALTLCDGNVSRAAAMLEINPSTIYRKKLTWDQVGAQAAQPVG